MNSLTCRFCKSPLTQTFVDLGMSPIANAMIPIDYPNVPESFYPLHVYVCGSCLLVQIPNTVERERIFNDKYMYFSSYSASWLEHAKRFTDMAIDRFDLSDKSFVIELASNDGYLLRYFVTKGIPALGIDPSENVAREAEAIGVPTLVEFFGMSLAKKLIKQNKTADLIIANNVLAHVPDINDFVGGIANVLKDTGTVTAEFPHVINLIEKNQFDTIYHEHYSYYSLHSISAIFQHHGMTVFDVEELPTHGGSLRIYAMKSSTTLRQTVRTLELLAREKNGGYVTLERYSKYRQKVDSTKHALLELLIELRRKGKHIIGYGAAAKGNTFLNFAGIRTDFIEYVVDDSEHKQNHLLPGTRIPVYAPSMIAKTRPDYALILPWNLKDEIVGKLSDMHAWGGKGIVAIPSLEIINI